MIYIKKYSLYRWLAHINTKVIQLSPRTIFHLNFVSFYSWWIFLWPNFRTRVLTEFFFFLVCFLWLWQFTRHCIVHEDFAIFSLQWTRKRITWPFIDVNTSLLSTKMYIYLRNSLSIHRQITHNIRSID